MTIALTYVTLPVTFSFSFSFHRIQMIPPLSLLASLFTALVTSPVSFGLPAILSGLVGVLPGLTTFVKTTETHWVVFDGRLAEVEGVVLELVPPVNVFAQLLVR